MSVDISGVVTWLKDWFYDKTEVYTKSEVDNIVSNIPSSGSDGNINAGSGLSKDTSTNTLNHSNSIAARTTAGIGDIKYDSEGHITYFSQRTVTDVPSQNSSSLFTAGGAYSLQANRVPTSHASADTTYGVGSTTNYGHCKIINDLNKTSYTDGEVLSAYQGYVLDQKISNFNLVDELNDVVLDLIDEGES